MIGVFVTFRYGDDFDERIVRKIAESARPSLKDCLGCARRRSRLIPRGARP